MPRAERCDSEYTAAENASVQPADYHGRQAALRGLKKPDGLHPGREFPPSMLAGEQYLDPLRTYVVEVRAGGEEMTRILGSGRRESAGPGGEGNVLDSEASYSHRTGVSKHKPCFLKTKQTIGGSQTPNLAFLKQNKPSGARGVSKNKPCGDTGKASTA